MGSGFLLDPETVRPHFHAFARAKLAGDELSRTWKKSTKVGFVVTNYHVINTGACATISLGDGTWGVAIGALTASESKDLALLLVFLQRDSEPEHLSLTTAIPEVGERVYAIGSPQDLEATMSDGIVSAVRRGSVLTLIQTTAPIGQGSSGGPLLSESGAVIGVTTLIHTGGQNLNFAVAASEIMSLLQAEFRPIQFRGLHTQP
jgi:S1-C subfamily serine protease